MRDTILYRHWQPGDDDAVLALMSHTNKDWYRQKFDNSNGENLEPEGIRLALANGRVVGHAMGEATSLFIEEKVQKFVLVTAVFVAQDMRHQGIATRLMQELNGYFESKAYRGSILDTYTEEARQLYQKVGYQQVTRNLRTQLPPRQKASQPKWTNPNPEDLSLLHQLDVRWARQNFPVRWEPRNINVAPSNMNKYRVFRRGGSIVGYANWNEPSVFYPNGLIHEPIAPDEDPLVVIRSVQATILTPRTWVTCVGSKYENPLRFLGCLLEPMPDVTMLLPFGQEIDLTGYYRTAY